MYKVHLGLKRSSIKERLKARLCGLLHLPTVPHGGDTLVTCKLDVALMVILAGFIWEFHDCLAQSVHYAYA